ncbi:MAG: hypothetical protein ACRD44_13370 [Bryobacteraceae bacterium]
MRAAAALWITLAAAASEYSAEELHRLSDRNAHGAAIDGSRVITWGDAVVAWPLDGSAPVTLARAAGGFGEGGCAFGDGLVLHELPARMVFLRRSGAIELIDTAADFRDCLDVTLFGRRGVLVVHRGAQVRFYESPHWRYREIYSIYTPSRQGGLLLRDVDGDRRPDILCGNYWIRSPERFDLPWRLFAIQDWWEREESALVRLAFSGALLAAQSEAAPARLAWFDRPADPKLPWNRREVEVSPPPRRVRALAPGSAPGTAIAGEDAGPGSRLLRIEGRRAEVIGAGDGFVAARVSGGDIVTVSRSAIVRWRPQRRR